LLDNSSFWTFSSLLLFFSYCGETDCSRSDSSLLFSCISKTEEEEEEEEQEEEEEEVRIWRRFPIQQ
jgi:hypothetical protein